MDPALVVHYLSPGHAIMDPPGQAALGDSGRALFVPPAGVQQPWDRSRATAQLWASVLSSELGCPKRPMALAAGRDIGKTGNSLRPVSDSQNLREFHISERLGNMRSRERSLSAGGIYCQHSKHLPTAAVCPKHRATMP